MADDYQLITSARYDRALVHTEWHVDAKGSRLSSPILLLPFHRDRLIESAHALGWPVASTLRIEGPVGLEYLQWLCLEAVDASYPGYTAGMSFKIRCLLAQDGKLSVQVSPVMPRPLETLLFIPPIPSGTNPDEEKDVLPVIFDTLPTPSSPFTSNKTTNRGHYNAARQRIGIQSLAEPREVLLWNEAGEITEGSLRNISFWRDGRWITPPSNSGCLPGVVRRSLLQRGLVIEGRMMKQDVREGEWVLTCNGVEGCRIGKIFFNQEQH